MVTGIARSIGSMNHKQRSSDRSLFAHRTLEALRALDGEGLGLLATRVAIPKGDVLALCEALEMARTGMTREFAVEATLA
jgi:hypothetical protein